MMKTVGQRRVAVATTVATTMTVKILPAKNSLRKRKEEIQA